MNGFRTVLWNAQADSKSSRWGLFSVFFFSFHAFTLIKAFLNGANQEIGDEGNSFGGIVIAGDREVNQRWVRVGIHDTERFDTQFFCFRQSEVFVVNINDEHGRWEPVELLNTAKVL